MKVGIWPIASPKKWVQLRRPEVFFAVAIILRLVAMVVPVIMMAAPMAVGVLVDMRLLAGLVLVVRRVVIDEVRVLLVIICGHVPFLPFAAAEAGRDVVPFDYISEEMLVVENMLCVLQLMGCQVLPRRCCLFLNCGRVYRVVPGTKDVITPPTLRITRPHAMPNSIPIQRITGPLAPTLALSFATLTYSLARIG